MADLKTNLLGFVMNSPIIGASGTVGYGVEYEELADFSRIGGISGKGLTLHGQYGNKGERLWETPSGLINSIGLQNPGVQHFIDVELNEMLELRQKYGTVVIANLGGHSEEEYVEGAAMLSDSAVDIVELNISARTSRWAAWPTASRRKQPVKWSGWSAMPAKSRSWSSSAPRPRTSRRCARPSRQPVRMPSA